MLAPTETAMSGIGISIPSVVERQAVHYLAIAASGPMRALPEFAPPKFEALHRWMRENGVPAGDGFFRYRRFGEDGGVEMEIATITDAPATGGGEVAAHQLPAGRYAFATYKGPYDRLFDAFAMLNGWIAARGLHAAGQPGSPECQAEIYRISPARTADPLQWETDLLLKLED